jgi:hypothetical protein
MEKTEEVEIRMEEIPLHKVTQMEYLSRRDEITFPNVARQCSVPGKEDTSSSRRDDSRCGSDVPGANRSSEAPRQASAVIHSKGDNPQEMDSNPRERFGGTS